MRLEDNSLKLGVGKILDAIKQLTEDEAAELIEGMRLHTKELRKVVPRTKDVWVVWAKEGGNETVNVYESEYTSQHNTLDVQRITMTIQKEKGSE